MAAAIIPHHHAPSSKLLLTMQLLAVCIIACMVGEGRGQDVPVPAPAPAPVPHPLVFGVDVSEEQGALNRSMWDAAHAGGLEFAIVKASEGINITNPFFLPQYNDSHQAGLLRGAYHVARPHQSDGATQAAFFLSNGGNFNASDELTLWGTLWLETNPACTEGTLCSLKDSCYGHNQSSMGMWIHDFLTTYNATIGSIPFIHTTADWYNSCVGEHGDFSKIALLWISCMDCPSITTLPSNWTTYIAWQYARQGAFPGNQNVHDESQEEQAMAPSPVASPPTI